MIYYALKSTIMGGNYNKEQIMSNMDLFLLGKRITEEQYVELVDLINAQN